MDERIPDIINVSPILRTYLVQVVFSGYSSRAAAPGPHPQDLLLPVGVAAVLLLKTQQQQKKYCCTGGSTSSYFFPVSSWGYVCCVCSSY